MVYLRAALTLLVAMIGALVFAVPTVDSRPNKVDICHGHADGTYAKISVSGNGNAVNAHIAHGDAFPGTAVPDMPDFDFDDDCVPVPVVQGCTVGGQIVETIVSQSECDALVELYSTTSGAMWNISTGWNTASDPCTWHGVTCQNGALTQVNLSSNGLTGFVAASIGDLTNLTRLRMAFNQLSGSLPATIGDLADLTDLQVNANQFTGALPASLGNLSNLQTLRLNQNAFEGSIPPAFGAMTSLENMELYGNNLSGSIPAELGNLVNLLEFRVESNQLSGTIPVEIFGLTSLTRMRVNNNQLSGSIPPEIGQLVNVVDLLANSNLFSGPIPSEIGDLDSLGILRLNNNDLSGTVPADIQDLGDTATALQLSGNGCLIADPTTATFLAGYDSNWDNGCP